MRLQIRDVPDLLAGILYLVLGGGAAGIASTYRMWSGGQVGPGYFPFGLGILLALLGVVVIASALRPGNEVRGLSGWDARPFFIVIGSVLVFALTLTALGLWLSVMLLVGISSLAERDLRWRGIVVSMLVLPTAAVLIFIYGLNLPIAALPRF